MVNSTIDKNVLIQMGFKQHTALSIIRQAKQMMVNKGYPFYNNKRLGRVPTFIVEDILGTPLYIENGEE